MKKLGSLAVTIIFSVNAVCVPSGYGDIPREKSLYEQAEDKVEEVEDSIHEWAGTSGARRYRPNILNAVGIGIDKKLREKMPGYSALADTVSSAIGAVGNGVEKAKDAIHEWAGTAGKKFRPSVPEAIEIGVGKRIEDAEEAVHEWAGTAGRKFRPSIPQAIGIGVENKLEDAEDAVHEWAGTAGKKFRPNVVDAALMGADKKLREKVPGYGVVSDAIGNAVDAFRNGTEKVANTIQNIISQPAVEKTSSVPVEPVQQKTEVTQPVTAVPVQTAPSTPPPASVSKTADLSAKVDQLLSGMSLPQEGQVAGGTMDIGGYINTVKSPMKSIEATIEESDEFREDLIESGDYWDFSGVIPNWDGGITTVDIPTYEEIIKWQEEQQAIAAAAALIGAAVAAGIAASQREESSGGGESAPEPQQYEKSQPSCGPC